ncbi:DUF308 domain-containing protein [Roseospira navarrensis]|uniref:Uncharacterized protein n=1 Tax=Roseospira navarrensis TaxID=140058 RepID=A0A7X1ZH36_9PROT|nr:DUF308 domain-containing protein [Roseospira navarrensis]MQX37337.1 hypothetical protein [Roseospira navarrensis]
MVGLLVVILLGIVAAIWPEMVLLGFALGPLGMAWFAAWGLLPVIAFYVAIILAGALVSWPLGRLRWGIGVLAALAVAFGVPWSANQQTDRAVAAWTAGDVRPGEPVAVDGPVLVRLAPVFTQGRKHPCGPLCQRLLYSGAAPRVLMLPPDREDETAPGFFIERREACPPVPGALPAVAARIAAGDCLVEAPTPVDRATLVYERTRVFDHDDDWRSWPWAQAIRLKRIEIRRGLEPEAERLYRRTAVIAKRLSTPFMIHFGGTSLPEGLAVIRRETANDTFDEEDGFQRPDEQVFGDAVRLSAPEPMDLRATIRAGLPRPGPDKTHAHVLMNEFLDSLWPADAPATDDDLALIELAVNDDRMDNFMGLSEVIHMRDQVPPSLVRAMADRLVRTPGVDYVTPQIADAFVALPPGEAEGARDRLETIARDPMAYPKAGRALSRLADSGPTVLPLLLDVLAVAREVRDRPVERVTVARSLELKVAAEAERGAILAFCRLGPVARPAVEDVLWAMLEARLAEPVVHHNIDAAIDALLSMGIDPAALEARFGASDRWRTVSGRIWSFEKDRRVGRPFCGRVLPPPETAGPGDP